MPALLTQQGCMIRGRHHSSPLCGTLPWCMSPCHSDFRECLSPRETERERERKRAVRGGEGFPTPTSHFMLSLSLLNPNPMCSSTHKVKRTHHTPNLTTDETTPCQSSVALSSRIFHATDGIVLYDRSSVPSEVSACCTHACPVGGPY